MSSKIVSRSANRVAPMGGGDAAPLTKAQAAAERQERLLAQAATWHLNRSLLTDQPGDSPSTLQARAKLREINGRFAQVMTTYDDAHAKAQAAQAAAAKSAEQLQAAKQAQAAAEAQYEADHTKLLKMATTAYTLGPASALQMFADSDSTTDLLLGIDVMGRLTGWQADVAAASQASQDKLEQAAAQVEASDAATQAHLAQAQSALAVAEAGRDDVLTNLAAARTLLTDRVLADELASSTLSAEAAAAAAAQYRATGAKVVFPLPAAAAFVDQHNYGHRSGHWASVHTGDDFSSPCGTPVLAATDGKIMIRTDQSWSGRWLVMISTGPGKLTTWYAHMEALTVTDGQQVKAGQAIGLVGQEGNATGCHLHFEVHPTGGSIYQDNTDPGAWLTAMGVYGAGGSS